MLGSRKRQRTMEERLLGGGGAEGGGEKVGRLDLDAPPPPSGASSSSGSGCRGANSKDSRTLAFLLFPHSSRK